MSPRGERTAPAGPEAYRITSAAEHLIRRERILSMSENERPDAAGQWAKVAPNARTITEPERIKNPVTSITAQKRTDLYIHDQYRTGATISTASISGMSRSAGMVREISSKFRIFLSKQKRKDAPQRSILPIL